MTAVSLTRPLGVGDRVLIRSPRPSDEAAFLAAVTASRGLHASWTSAPATSEDYAAYLRRGRRRNCIQCLIVHRDPAALVGVVNINEIVRGSFQSAYLGYYAFNPFARRGLMREGLGLVLDHAFDAMRLHRLEANIQPANESSRRLIERLGFRLEGVSPRYLKIAGRWRDHERWAILAEDWKTARRTLQGGAKRS